MIPFAQNAAFYMKRGAKELEKNDLLAALTKYREAYARAPEDVEISLALAEVLSQMQRFEESNRILYLLRATGQEIPAECDFGLACNYFGMQDFDCAADCLEEYLDQEPDGLYALDAEDFLDLIDDDDAMSEMTGLKTDDDYEDDAVCRFARSLISSGDAQWAIEELEKRLEKPSNSQKVREQLSIAYFCDNRRLDARESAERVLAAHPKSVLSLCTLALADLDAHDRDAARKRLEEIQKIKTNLPEELNSISVVQIDLGRYRDAEKTLLTLLNTMPYDENVLHRLGYVRYLQGDVDGAKRYYRKLLKIDPTDTIAKYYLSQCKPGDEARALAASRWLLQYQVPFGETLRRLNHISRMLSLEKEKLYETWRNDPSFRALIGWALLLDDMRVKKGMLSMLYVLGDKHAERMLRSFLLRTDQPNDLKESVFGMLKGMGAREPYKAFFNGRWVDGRVDLLEFDGELPPAYQRTIQTLMHFMLGNCRDVCVQEAGAIFKRYIASFDSKLPRITIAQESSFAAALEYLSRTAYDETVDESELCRVYHVNATRLRNAISKFKPFASTPEKTI